jgi:phage terminase small subunit
MGRKKKETALSKLSDKHKLFVKNYIANFAVAYKAYMATYPNASYNTARTKGPELVAKDVVKKAIEEEYQETYAAIQTETEKSKTYQLIHSIGSSDISDVVDLEEGTLRVKNLSEIPIEALPSIQSIEMDEKQSESGFSKNLKIKLHPKLKALEMRARIQKLIDTKDDMSQVDIVIKPAVRPSDKKNKKPNNNKKQSDEIEITVAQRPEEPEETE